MKKLTIILSIITLVIAFNAKDLSAMHLSAYGGYNYLSGDAVDYYNGAEKGGFGGAAELWFMDDLQIGIGIGFLQIYTYEEDLSGYETIVYFIPIMVNARYYILGGLYGGAGIGYHYAYQKSDLGTVEGGSCFAVQFMTGYDIFLMDSLILGLTVRYAVGYDGDYEWHNLTVGATVGVKF